MKLLRLFLLVLVCALMLQTINFQKSETQAASSGSQTIAAYRIDAAQSKFMVHAERGGLLWFKGYDHFIKVRDFSREVQITPSVINPASLQMTIPAASLEETGADFTQPQKINQIKQTRRVSSELPLQSPVPGTITAREVNSGEVVAANKELFKVTNLATVWLIAEVYEKDLQKIRTGSGASVTSDAFPGRVFRGQVTYIDPNFNQATRTAQIRIVLENPNQIFKVGQYVNVAFGSLGMAERTAPVVPISAVQTINNQKVVFLATDKPHIFILRQVNLGAEQNGSYTVSEGVNVRDKVVAEGSFLLRAEWIKQHPNEN